MKAKIAYETDMDNSGDWNAIIKDDLLAVEEQLAESLTSSVPTLSDITSHLLHSGGKRLRPALVLLSARSVGNSTDPSKLKAIGATVELIHMATLIHDDVIDSADLRRGRATANSYWGNRLSILSGDSLLARAFHLLATYGDQRIMQAISDMTIRMSESEVLQATCERSVVEWKKHYWQIIRHKTADFFSACCICGAMLADAPDSLLKALSSYSINLGMAFQLTDDILDIAGERQLTGKPVGNDIREGKATLPTLLHIESLSGEDQIRAIAIVEDPNSADKDVDALCEQIALSGAIDAAREHAKEFAERAIEALEAVPESDARDSLRCLAYRVIDRLY